MIPISFFNPPPKTKNILTGDNAKELNILLTSLNNNIANTKNKIESVSSNLEDTLANELNSLQTKLSNKASKEDLKIYSKRYTQVQNRCSSLRFNVDYHVEKDTLLSIGLGGGNCRWEITVNGRKYRTNTMTIVVFKGESYKCSYWRASSSSSSHTPAPQVEYCLEIS